MKTILKNENSFINHTTQLLIKGISNFIIKVYKLNKIKNAFN